MVINDQGVTRRCEFALGHLMPPAGLTAAEFFDQWWDHGLHLALGLDHDEPDWLDQPALGRLTVTNPTDAKAFAPFNTHRRYDEHIRPWGFAATATPTPREQARTGVRLLVAPHTRDQRKRRQLRWVDRDIPAASYRIRTGDDGYVLDDTITVTRLRDYFRAYFVHPETKAVTVDAEPCGPDTVGLLQPPSVTRYGDLGRIGKETNRVTTDTDLSDTDDVGLVYPRLSCRGCNASVSHRRAWCTDACRKRTARLARA
jgi:hypothetical protein